MAKTSNSSGKRTSQRRAARVKLELSRLGEAPIREVAFTEDLSQHGARVVTKNRWHPFEHVQVKFLPEGVLCPARIAYCDPSRGKFATGLVFPLAIDGWIVPHEPQTSIWQRILEL